MTLLLALIAAFALFLLSVTLVLFIVGPSLLLRPRRRRAEFYRALGLPVTPTELALPHEEINVTAAPGLKLNCWLIKAAAPVKGTILHLHGLADCKLDGLRLAKLFHDHHYNVMLYDARDHGESDGEFCTYGYFEKHDVPTVIDYLQTRSDIAPGRIGIFGTSMGAAVALQAAAIDGRIAAVVAENSFATLRTIFDDYQKRMVMLPFHFLRNIVIKRSEYLARFRANDVSPLDCARSLRIPVMFIYGTDDHLINCRYSVALYDAKPAPKDLFAIPGAKHNDTWKTAGGAYEQKLLTFFDSHLR
jgi:pimeloyl-ACP methyl ester carboxylesterase